MAVPKATRDACVRDPGAWYDYNLDEPTSEAQICLAKAAQEVASDHGAMYGFYQTPAGETVWIVASAWQDSARGTLPPHVTPTEEVIGQAYIRALEKLNGNAVGPTDPVRSPLADAVAAEFPGTLPDTRN